MARAMLPDHPFRAVITRLLPLALACALAAGASAHASEPIAATAIPLDARDPERTRFGSLELLAAYVLTSADKRFGGLSGLTVGADGARITLLSDRAWSVGVDLVHNADGRLTGFGATEAAVLRDSAGAPLVGFGSDAEALTTLPDGRFAISFEGVPRIDVYPDGLAGLARPRVGRRVFGPLSNNGSLEAMTAWNGGFLALVEDPGPDGMHAGFLIDEDGEAARLTYQGPAAFKPTDIAVLPDGNLLVLERKFSVLEGAHGRLACVDGAAIKAGANLVGDELAVLSPPLATDNFEGVVARPVPGGGVLVYMVSDDNFNPLQRTLLLQFRLSD